MKAKMKKFPSKIAQKILKQYKPIWAQKYLIGLADWDLNTYMPEGGAKARGEAVGQAESIIQQKYLQPELQKDLDRLQNLENKTIYEKALVRVMKREIEHYKKLPPEFVAEFNRTASEGQIAWRNAKKNSDFSIFRDHLAKLIKLTLEKAEYLGYKNHPYDPLIDEFEEGWTVKDLDKYFESIRTPLKELIKTITSKKDYKPEHKLEKAKYDLEKMKRLNHKILEFLKFNKNYSRLDTAPHPFTSEMTTTDTRITTRYSEADFRAPWTATVHEFGHMIYEVQGDPELEYTPLGEGTTLGVHESQSRFYENFIGRSKPLIEKFLPDIQKLGKQLQNATTDDVFDYFNMVRPSLIRVEADEVTYHMHILIRYDLEKALLERKLKVDDLPEAWNSKYEESLGITPPNDARGVLQDIHWSMGVFGYFPTYSIGTTLSAQWKHFLEKDIGSINDLVSNNGISQIHDWLKKNVHIHGKTYDLNNLVKFSTGSDFSSKFLLNYLQKKYA
ncbi:carboxypeptidase M32 [Candidatus Dojkabacteria bacterium]|nr:carboxypeptidase M32 [Candidatus Dojkabacteria bacterium]